jgi:hypothetical protein
MFFSELIWCVVRRRGALYAVVVMVEALVDGLIWTGRWSGELKKRSRRSITYG